MPAPGVVTVLLASAAALATYLIGDALVLMHMSDAIVQKVAAHLEDERHVKVISGTLANYVKTAIRKT